MAAPARPTFPRVPGRKMSPARQTLGAGLLVIVLAALAAAVAVPWNAAASTAHLPGGAQAVMPAAIPGPADAPATPLLADGPDPGTEATRGEDARRTPRQIAAALERKLLDLQEARARGDQQRVQALKRALLEERRLAPDELEGQLKRGTTPVYWAVTLVRDAVLYDDDAAIERALRYLRAISPR